MIKRLDRFLLKTYIGPFILTFVIGDFILLMQFFWKYFDELVGKGLGLPVITKLTLYAATTFVPMALPIGILLSSLITFGNLGERYELVALKSSGISLNRIFAPLIMFALLVSCLSAYFCQQILPKTNLKFQSVFFDIRQKKLTFNLEEGIYYSGLEGYMIRIDKKEPDDRTVRGIMIYSHKGNAANKMLTLAEWGTMDIDTTTSTLILTLHNGYSYDDSYGANKMKDYPFKRLHFEVSEMRFDMSQFDMNQTDESLYSNNYKNLVHRDLKEKIRYHDSVLSRREDSYMELATNCFEAIKDTTNVVKNIDDAIYGFLKSPVWENIPDSIDKMSVKHAALDKAKSDKQIAELRYNTLEYERTINARHQSEEQYRYAIAVACLVLFLVGAPLGAIIRKGGLGFPLVVAVVIFILYYIILTSGQKSALEGTMSPIVGIWLANIIVLPIGLFLTAKAAADAPVVDKDYWVKIYLKVVGFFKKLKRK